MAKITSDSVFGFSRSQMLSAQRRSEYLDNITNHLAARVSVQMHKCVQNIFSRDYRHGLAEEYERETNFKLPN
jgi:hypothetical protein